MRSVVSKPMWFSRSAKSWFGYALTVFVILTHQLASVLLAEDPAGGTGFLVRVPLPLTGSGDNRIKQAIQQVVKRLPKEGKRGTLVLEFTPTSGKGEGTDFARALSLAKYLSSPELAQLTTVAYVPQSVRGHGLLMISACEYVAVAPDAEIGDAGVDEPGQSISATVRTGYTEVARGIPAAVSLAMLDRSAELLAVETERGTEPVLAANLPDFKQQRAVLNSKQVKRPGESGVFNGRMAREQQWIQFLSPDRATLAKQLSLPTDGLQEDPTLLGQLRPIRVNITTPIGPNPVNRIQRTIEDSIRNDNINFVLLYMNTGGGSLPDSVRLANYLAELDPGQVRTVAYVAREARGDAALIAAACDEVVLSREGQLGGQGAEAFSHGELVDAKRSLAVTFPKYKHRSWSLPMACIDGDLDVFRCQDKTTGVEAFLSEEELAQRPDANQWTVGKAVTVRGQPILITPEEWNRNPLPLVRHVIQDTRELDNLYGLEGELPIPESTWSSTLVDALASRGAAILLLVIAIGALFIELHAPGIGLAGFISGVCFLLYFWGQILGGTAGWLEVLLFLGGVCCIMLEVFVLPGVAIFGLGGGLMVLASLVLASQTFIIPRNSYQWERLGETSTNLLAVGFGATIFLVVAKKYLPHTTVYHRWVLSPPSHEEKMELAVRETLTDYHDLLGQHGQATTRLGPSGKARFGSQNVDVITSGELIERGARVEVTHVAGNRVVVRAVS